MPKQLDMTTALDLLGLALVAAGAGWGVSRWIGAFGLAVAGALVIGGSWLAARASK